ncbi:hypothetical protein [Variovorax sp. UC74_104]|uniref:hypothetical protein n=1 Tax=Variovorax sp. UC74_104 TaxID=3374555 RepID=UPI003756C68E
MIVEPEDIGFTGGFVPIGAKPFEYVGAEEARLRAHMERAMLPVDEFTVHPGYVGMRCGKYGATCIAVHKKSSGMKEMNSEAINGLRS